MKKCICGFIAISCLFLTACAVPLRTLSYRDTKPGYSAYSTALKAYKIAISRGYTFKKPLITLVDFSLPSSEKRLWVIDTKTNTVLLNLYVTHGKNSGKLYAKYFSDRPGSHESSLGAYTTSDSFYGPNGYSLTINGIDKGFNDEAESRVIVVHGATYANQQFLHAHHYLGRSWGCFAVPTYRVKQFINLIRNNTFLFAYYPSQQWIRHSEYSSQRIHSA